jgi:glyoxylase-like metal-dependent hydrolase (beta-lactamase superfamily II)
MPGLLRGPHHLADEGLWALAAAVAMLNTPGPDAKVRPADLTLILHTHLHRDHVRSTAALRRHTDAPVVYHPADELLMRQGQNGKLTPTSVFSGIPAWLLSYASFETITRDVDVGDNMRLDAFGITGHVVHTPGHTPGSISLVLAAGAAPVDDLLMGGRLAGKVCPYRSHNHYFADDLSRAHASLARLLTKPVKMLFPGHGGPLTAEAVHGWAAGNAMDAA